MQTIRPMTDEERSGHFAGKHIVVLPYGGLCNRMNATASAVALASDGGAEVDVIWTPKSWCNAPYAELFEPIVAESVRLHDIKYLPLKYQRSLPRNLRQAGTLRRLRGVRNVEDYYPQSDGDLGEIVGDANRVYISSCQRFIPSENIRKLFTPRADILATLDHATEGFTPLTYGFHIRRGDHAYSIAHSPLEAFVARMDELCNDAEARFYLATDDADVKANMRKRYGSRILTYEATLERGSLRGMKDAVVELYALSRTCKIFGSATSSYSEMAAEIGDIQIEMVVVSE